MYAFLYMLVRVIYVYMHVCLLPVLLKSVLFVCSGLGDAWSMYRASVSLNLTHPMEQDLAPNLFKVSSILCTSLQKLQIFNAFVLNK